MINFFARRIGSAAAGHPGGVAGDHAGRLLSTGLLNGGGGVSPTDQLAGEPDPPRVG